MLVAGETVVLFLQNVPQLALPMIEESRVGVLAMVEWSHKKGMKMCKDYCPFSCTFHQVHRLNYVAIG